MACVVLFELEDLQLFKYNSIFDSEYISCI